MESPFEEPYPPNEEFTATSSKLKVHLDDVKVLATSLEHKVHFYDLIKRIERLNLDENSTPSQSVEKPRPHKKGPPKWIIKKLESVHRDEVIKIGARISTIQYGGNVDISNSGDIDNPNLGDVDDMEILYDCDLNLSNDFEPNSFEEATSHDQ
jgi:hypothetical protein